MIPDYTNITQEIEIPTPPINPFGSFVRLSPYQIQTFVAESSTSISEYAVVEERDKDLMWTENSIRDFFFDQVYDYLLSAFDPKWSEQASIRETKILDLLHKEGFEKIAARLDLLIEDLAEDNEVFTWESLLAFAHFVRIERPQYPGPGIFGDDNGHVGIQWRVPPEISPDTTDLNNAGILYLEFISQNRIRCFGSAEGIENLNEETTLPELMNTIKEFTERLDW